MRGRRRVGKSRLADEFLRRGARPPVPYVLFTASRQPLARELEMFAQDVARSELPAAAVVRGGDVTFESWDGPLTFLATAAGGTPQVIVMDEFPYPWSKTLPWKRPCRRSGTGISGRLRYSSCS
jgi:hypothetical protein